jgi:rhamnosyltransferase
MRYSVIIRTLNEEKYLQELINAIKEQKIDLEDEIEIILVDSGSTDQTLEIAKKNNLKIVFIKKEVFSFGRSLNIGCRASNGELLVFISGHCIPVNTNWLLNLCLSLKNGGSDYNYGKQIGVDTSYYSEHQYFKKFFPSSNKDVLFNGFFCNNANSAIKRNVWEKYKFNENITGLEDMYLTQQITQDNMKVSYIPEASVKHIHQENFKQIKNRYERESIALRWIIPDIKITFFEFVKIFFLYIISDFSAAKKEKVFLKNFFSILFFRFAMSYGSYIGNSKSNKLSEKSKKIYFYPND